MDRPVHNVLIPPRLWQTFPALTPVDELHPLIASTLLHKLTDPNITPEKVMEDVLWIVRKADKDARANELFRIQAAMPDADNAVQTLDDDGQIIPLGARVHGIFFRKEVG